MKRTLVLAAAVAALSLPSGDAGAVTSQRYTRVAKVSDAKASQYPLGPFPTTLPADISQLAPLLDDTFDPAEWDEMSVAGDGRLLAYASNTSDLGLPGTVKHVVVQTVGGASQNLTVTGAACDQPSIQFDEFGWRCAFRSTAGGNSLVQLHDFRRAGATPEEKEKTTALAGVTAAREPALAARSRVRDVGSGIKVHESDARVAFVSTGNLNPGSVLSNPDHFDQLFVWEEQGGRVRQLTENKQAGVNVVNRPTIAKSGDVIFFESTADLTPQEIDPLDSSRVGNPAGKRQIFRWTRGGKVQLEQVTWFDEDCFSPRTDLAGRFVLFCSRGDPFGGANADANFEIFAWDGALTQMTQSSVGHNVFPRPTARLDLFAFYSSCPTPADGASVPITAFGASGVAELAPKPYVYRKKTIDFVHGLADFGENSTRLTAATTSGGTARTQAQRLPVFSGPPVPGLTVGKVFFAENQLPRKGRKAPPDVDRDALPTAVILRASR